jgi:hypothetical protein
VGEGNDDGALQVGAWERLEGYKTFGEVCGVVGVVEDGRVVAADESVLGDRVGGGEQDAAA